MLGSTDEGGSACIGPMTYTVDYFWRLSQMICMLIPIYLTYLYKRRRGAGGKQLLQLKALVVAPSREYREKWTNAFPLAYESIRDLFRDERRGLLMKVPTRTVRIYDTAACENQIGAAVQGEVLKILQVLHPEDEAQTSILCRRGYCRYISARTTNVEDRHNFHSFDEFKILDPYRLMCQAIVKVLMSFPGLIPTVHVH